MLQTLGTTAEFLCKLLLTPVEGCRGGARWEVRPRRGVIADVDRDAAGTAVEAWAEADTGVAGDTEDEAGSGHGAITGIKGGLWNGR